MEKDYRPLKEGLYIGQSSIEGNGLFSTILLKKKDYLGISHVPVENNKHFPKGLVRTPLAGFLNHSDNPNCELIDQEDATHMFVIEDIPPGYELTVDYSNCRCGQEYMKKSLKEFAD